MIWYEDEVQRIEKIRSTLQYEPETVFYGSSSFTLWPDMYSDFKEFQPINLGFGGSTLAACVWFFDRVMDTVKAPRRFVIYAGDNDLGDGRHPTEVLLFYRQLIGLIRTRFGNIPCFFVSIKPSIQRWEIISLIRTANELIHLETESDPQQHYIDIVPPMVNYQGYPRKSLFEDDGLHLSPEGYRIWQKAISESLHAEIDREAIGKTLN